MHKKIQVLAILPIPLFSLFNTAPVPASPLAQKEMSLENRYNNPSVNGVFKDNILLNLAYLRGSVTSKQNLNWEEVKKPFTYEFKLDPNKTFAFHEDVLPNYQGSLIKHTNAHFNATDGFKTDGYLYGDGVCHLASLIYWTAKEANLNAEAPVNHDFMNIPDVPREFGVSIYKNPGAREANAKQNLYVTNNKNKPISFKFEYDGSKVKVAISELN